MSNHEARFHSGLPCKKCRETLTLVRINQAIRTAFAHAHQIGKPDRGIIERERERRAMEISAGNHVTHFCKHKWIIGRRGGFDPQYLFTMTEYAAYRAVHLRHASQTVRILHARIVFEMRLTDLAALQERQKMFSRRFLARVGPRSL